jgi:streptomycin 3"-kinase
METTLDWTDAVLGRWRFGWTRATTGESGDLVYHRDDRLAYAKLAPAARSGDRAGERDRLLWLDGQGVACPEVIDWHEAEEGVCLVMSAIPGIPAAELSGADLLKAWPSMARQLNALQELAAEQCPLASLGRMSRNYRAQHG